MKLLTTILLASSVQLIQCRVQTDQQQLEESMSSHDLLLLDDLFSFHKNLTQIESITQHEQSVGDWLAQSLVSQGWSVEKQQISQKPSRFNVLAWPGTRRDAPILMSSHIDTVPPFYPYKRVNGTISGRGAVDAKGSVAAQLIAVNELLSDEKLHKDDIAVLYVVGEETGGDGMRAANKLDLKPRRIIFGEPTEGKLAAGHKGNLGVLLTAIGKASHSGYPWLGRSANEVLLKALAGLLELGESLPTSDKYGKTTINIGTMSGGVAANVVAQDATADIAIRIATGTPDYIKSQVTKAVQAAVKEFLKDGLKAEDIIKIEFTSTGYGPIDIDHDVDGLDVITVNYGTDIPNFERTVEHQKRYLYGPGSILVAHSDHEALTEDELTGAVDGYKRIVLHALTTLGEKRDL